jgi:hypothetical protein
MKRKVLISLSLTVSVVCGTALLTAEGPATYQTENLFRAGMPSMKLQGAATLFRTDQSLQMRIAATHLDPNTAYTVWWVVFNNPAGCIGPCGAMSLGVPAARASVFYAAGFVTGDDGTGNVTGHVNAGTLPIGVEVIPEGTVAGLDRGNGFGAEVHLVVRSHGPVLVGMANQQIGSFNGACPPNSCMNQQAAVFAPVMVKDDN